MPKQRKGRKEAYAEKGQRGIVQQAYYDVGLPEELVRRVEREARSAAYLTPYLVHSKYGVSMTTARRILRELEKRGVLELYSPGRRSPIYVPASGKS